MNETQRAVIEMAIVRLLLMASIYKSTTMTQLTKVKLLISLDLLKNSYFLTRLNGLPSLVNNALYQNLDKPIDLVAYWLVLNLVHDLNYTPSQIALLKKLLWYRLVGVLGALSFQKRWILLVFPDFFKEALLGFYLQDNTNLARSTIGVIVAVLVVLKLFIEYSFHVRMKGLSDIALDLFDGAE